MLFKNCDLYQQNGWLFIAGWILKVSSAINSDYIFIAYISTGFTVIFLYDYGENIGDAAHKKCTEKF